jgi:hypothetical protein
MVLAPELQGTLRPDGLSYGIVAIAAIEPIDHVRQSLSRRDIGRIE